MGTVYHCPPAFMHPSARQVQGGSIDRKHPMPLPPTIRVGPDFPCVPGSAFGVEDHLEDCLVQGLEQFLSSLARALQMEDGDTGAGCGSSIPIVRHCPHSSASVLAYPGRPFENTSRKTNSTTTSLFSTRRRRCQSRSCRWATPTSVSTMPLQSRTNQRILRSKDCCRRPARTASRSTGAGQQHLLPVFRQSGYR